jgi:hypothetical protein
LEHTQPSSAPIADTEASVQRIIVFDACFNFRDLGGYPRCRRDVGRDAADTPDFPQGRFDVRGTGPWWPRGAVSVAALGAVVTARLTDGAAKGEAWDAYGAA